MSSGSDDIGGPLSFLSSSPLATLLTVTAIAVIATTLGAIPWVAGSGRTPRRAVWAYSSAGGVMIGLSHLLTLEGLERSPFQCILGAVLGATYTYWLQKPSEPAEEEANKSELEAQAQLKPIVLRGSFHSAAEGIAIGAAAATSTTLGMFLAVALAVHNIGEGMVLTHRVSFIEEIPAPRWLLPTLVKLPQLPCAAVIFLGLQTWPPSASPHPRLCRRCSVLSYPDGSRSLRLQARQKRVDRLPVERCRSASDPQRGVSPVNRLFNRDSRCAYSVKPMEDRESCSCAQGKGLQGESPQEESLQKGESP